jgi:hypothetical protein
MYTDVPKEFALNGGQRKKLRKAEGRSGEVQEIHDLIRELECQRKKRTTAGMTDINEADRQRAALFLYVAMSGCGKVLAGQGDTVQTDLRTHSSALERLISL